MNFLKLQLICLSLLIFSCSPEKKTDLSQKKLPEVAHKLQGIKSHLVKMVGHKEFYVADRTSKIGQFACSNCHQDELPDRQQQNERSALMHLDIKMQHANQAVMDCRTCHNAKNMDSLRLNNGDEVSFNHAYKLCSQCHFEQERDWAGGAHGKRLHSWYGKRVVMNCTECHNPHSPSFTQRHPKGRPTIPRTGKNH
ncbi:hypothetical protein PQO03_11035 [Lentisphaera profundi]|uniref:Cytochrome c7-like domain-containing protein n=1 Tax=Lentisphaera profundi TaxID=1658616 RepID=A0ABY7VQW0_9BACT|nr:hypothetical protein [Lentisphaera profundi]WDE96241.1 hypothetical protein PQO03_11035 [Lentisphaera profundi]